MSTMKLSGLWKRSKILDKAWSQFSRQCSCTFDLSLFNSSMMCYLDLCSGARALNTCTIMRTQGMSDSCRRSSLADSTLGASSILDTSPQTSYCRECCSSSGKGSVILRQYFLELVLLLSTKCRCFCSRTQKKEPTVLAKMQGTPSSHRPSDASHSSASLSPENTTKLQSFANPPSRKCLKSEQWSWPRTSGFISTKLAQAISARGRPTESCSKKKDCDRCSTLISWSSQMWMLPTPGSTKFFSPSIPVPSHPTRATVDSVSLFCPLEPHSRICRSYLSTFINTKRQQYQCLKKVMSSQKEILTRIVDLFAIYMLPILMWLLSEYLWYWLLRVNIYSIGF